MVEQQFQKPHSTNAHPYQAKCATDKEKTTKTNVSNPMSKRILKNTPSQSRERPPIVATPTSCHRLSCRQTNPADTITHHHTTKCSTPDYTCCKRIIGKTTHHNLPHYNIVGKSHDPILPPYNIIGKDTHGCSPSYNFARKGHAPILPPYNIAGKDTH